jgi:hypothetical protein
MNAAKSAVPGSNSCLEFDLNKEVFKAAIAVPGSNSCLEFVLNECS